MKKLLITVLLFSCYFVSSQSSPNSNESNLSPNGVLENVFDHYGNKYSLSDLLIGKELRNTKGEVLRTTNPTPSTCGYFNLYFESDCGMDNISIQAEADRRNVACQVFNDLSAFINLPPNTPSTFRINIWVRNINNIIVPPDSPNGVLGLASSFYTMPNNSATGFGGIVDNEIWKCIHTGKNSYTNVSSPLVTNGINAGPSGVFYHGMMAFNFNTNNNPSFNWNTNTGIATPAGFIDLYSVMLHELVHSLGFASLINQDGVSLLGAGFNYFTRYDSFLKNNANTSLITNSGSCSMYNYSFNSANLSPSVLRPGCGLPNNINNSGTSSGVTVCNTALRFGGTSTVPIYTPTCFERGSSFSHFEDRCISPPNQNVTNSYFAMTDAIGAGQTKRFLRAEERNALCNIGYSVNTTFGTAFNGFINYGGRTPCQGITVAGLNDGINSNGTYTFIGYAGDTIPISGILNNDTGATGFECLEDVYSSATVSPSSGTASTTINFTNGTVGLHLLRYVPINGTQKGNITYIFVYVVNSSCTPSACNVLNNGGFEASNLCGQFGVTNPPPTIQCWENLAQSPDLLKRGCTTGANAFFPDGVYNVGVSTLFSIPATDSHDGGSNNSFVGLYYRNDYLEALQTTLSSPLLQSQQYVLSFWAKVDNGYTSSTNVPIPLNFSSLPTIMVPINLVNQNFQTVVPASVQIVPTTLVPNDNVWHFYSYTFTFSSNNHNAVGMYTGANSSTNSYVFVDDVSINPIAQVGSFTLPSSICMNQSLSNLATYLSATPTNGVFSGPGVSLSGTTYSFNSTTAGLGLKTITYTYTNNLGCSITISSTITVSACSTSSCPGNLVFNTTEPSTNATYQASNTIITNTSYLVNTGSTIILKAGNSITFSPSSEVKASSASNFTAQVAACTQTSAKMDNLESEVTINSDLILFPNPTSDFTTIHLYNEEFKRVIISTVDGRIILNEIIKETSEYNYNTSHLTSGIYIVSIETSNGGMISKKLIKK